MHMHNFLVKAVNDFLSYKLIGEICRSRHMMFKLFKDSGKLHEKIKVVLIICILFTPSNMNVLNRLYKCVTEASKLI